ncbi:MAG: nucleoside-diphosphate kinase [Candidatus Liberibacter europaeus]|uniref:Nucleoside diphosphate kinase n=1 Tax=Candidatus Liberibacter europaeus TaxID=744859 RepID=A0A2T4VXR3_9HYPH|nr:nucleoside-diphosphate kinase [Candidatus Liberibacter europaeus]PTL86566.1 MAG: nucleoside-diphosphate kinase [Candidatus Liberibacter europaeus]
MTIERTFSMIKPDAVRRRLIGTITKDLEDSGLCIIASKLVLMNRCQAKAFYQVHSLRPFFDELVQTITSGPVVVQVLEGEDAVRKNRDIMGDTDPKKAANGTIRKKYGLSISENSIHGSDSLKTAGEEIFYWFSTIEIIG